MRFLGVAETCDLGSLYLALKREGHDVRVAVSDPMAQGTLAGLIDKTPDWRGELDWLRASPDGHAILFESVSEGFGALQDDLRRQGFTVIGGSAFGDRLENDRAFAQAVLADLGFPKGHVWSFPDPLSASAFIDARPGRYVMKQSGADHTSSDTFVGQAADGRDVAAVLRARAKRPGAGGLILMEFIDGIEMGVGAYFNGERFLRPACLDWEHKRFFAGDMGELTGEMGTVATFDRTDAFFDRTLALMEPMLRDNGYVGYINLNTIVNEAGVWPLEFSCRFGYPGFAILAPLQAIGWGELFRAMATRSSEILPTRPGFSTGVVLTTPPFPYDRTQVDEPVGLPVLFDGEPDPGALHYGEVGLDETGQLVTSGLYGWTMVVTGVGSDISASKRRAYATAANVRTANLRYRLDIGDRLIAGDFERLERMGLLDPPPAANRFTQQQVHTA